MIINSYWGLSLKTFLLFFCLFLSIPGKLGAAAPPSIEELVVTNTNTSVLLFLNVNHALTEEMIAGVHNGIPVTFTYSVELSRKRKGWLDQEVISFEFDHSISYDTLKEEYSVKLDERPAKIFKTKVFAEAEKLMTQVNGVTVAPLSSLIPDEDYMLRVKARQAEKTLPLYFHYVIPFWGLWDFETDWYTIEFRY